MKKIITLLLLISGTPLFSQKLENSVLGKWTMFQVEKEGMDVTAEHNPKGNRFFIFKSDGTFESGGDPYGRNTGRYLLIT
ncbi:MAG: hypothetical protein RIM99_20175 [Cyclobacteriaceae bacterium]